MDINIDAKQLVANKIPWSGKYKYSFITPSLDKIQPGDVYVKNGKFYKISNKNYKIPNKNFIKENDDTGISYIETTDGTLITLTELKDVGIDYYVVDSSYGGKPRKKSRTKGRSRARKSRSRRRRTRSRSRRRH